MVVFYLFIVLSILSFVVYLYLNHKNKRSNYPAYRHTEISVSEENESFELPWDIYSVPSTEMQIYEPPKLMTLTDDLKNRISDVIKLTPSAKDLVQTEKKIVVKFSENVLKKVQSGELKVMHKKGSMDQFRTIAVDQKNKIRHHGWLELKEIKKINPVQLANLAMGVMTIITAQEHLDKINKQLNVIDKKVDSLLRINQNDRVGKIQGSIRYLKSILPDLQNVEKKQIYLTKIEDVSLQCYQEIQSLLQEFPQILKEMKNVKEKSMYGLDNIVNEIEGIASTFEQKLLTAFGNLEVMSICLKIRNDFEENTDVNLNRLQDLENDYNSLLGFHSKLKRNLLDKKHSLDATFRTNNAVSKRKEQIEKQLSYLNENIQGNIQNFNYHLDQLKNSNNSLFNEQIDLQVEYDDENIVTAVYGLKRAF